MSASETISPSARRKARHFAMQGLYQWKMAGASINAIEAELRTDNDMRQVDLGYFHELLHQVPQRLDRKPASPASTVTIDRPPFISKPLLMTSSSSPEKPDRRSQ